MLFVQYDTVYLYIYCIYVCVCVGDGMEMEFTAQNDGSQIYDMERKGWRKVCVWITSIGWVYQANRVLKRVRTW